MSYSFYKWHKNNCYVDGVVKVWDEVWMRMVEYMHEKPFKPNDVVADLELLHLFSSLYNNNDYILESCIWLTLLCSTSLTNAAM